MITHCAFHYISHVTGEQTMNISNSSCDFPTQNWNTKSRFRQYIRGVSATTGWNQSDSKSIKLRVKENNHCDSIFESLCQLTTTHRRECIQKGNSYSTWLIVGIKITFPALPAADGTPRHFLLVSAASISTLSSASGVALAWAPGQWMSKTIALEFSRVWNKLT